MAPSQPAAGGLEERLGVAAALEEVGLVYVAYTMAPEDLARGAPRLFIDLGRELHPLWL